MKKIGLIGVPSSAGARRTGQELAPAQMRQQALLGRLMAEGLDVIDLGDTQMVTFVKDDEHPKAQNVKLVAKVAKEVVEKISLAKAREAMPLVVGGDCTITLGVLSGLQRYHDRLGLIYFDGDVDLNTPETTHTGILDGMVMAHIVGKGDQALSRLGYCYPLLPEQRIMLFGYNTESGWIDPEELLLLGGSGMKKYPAHMIRGMIEDHAVSALSDVESASDQFLVHFDVDVIDMHDLSLADVAHKNGLTLTEVMGALKIFVSHPRCAGLVITEINPSSDSKGVETRKLLDALTPVFAHMTS